MVGVEVNYNNYCKDFKVWVFLKEVFYSQFLCSNLWFTSEVFESNLSSTLFYFHLQTLSFNPTYYSLGFYKEKFFKREFVVFWSPSEYCTCGYTTSGLEECDWGVGHFLVIVILCGNSSGSEILLGEGGDVELSARTSKQISVFAIGLLVSFTFYSFILILSIYTLTQDCIAYLKLLFRGIMRKKSRALHGVYGF